MRSFPWILFSLFGLLIYTLSTGAVVAKPSSDYLGERTSFLLPHTVSALAFSADEALIAVAMDRGNSGSLIQIHDRASTKVLSRLKTQIPQVTGMRFSVKKNQLAISGASRIELWDLNSVLQGNLPVLSKEQRLWEYNTNKKSQKISNLKFSKKHFNFIWSEGAQIKKLSSKPPFSSDVLWQGATQDKILRFALDLPETQLALSDTSGNQIRIITLDSQENLPALDYHPFPVQGLHFEDANTLLSLDQERNLIQGNITKRIKQQGGVLKGLSAKESPVRLMPLKSKRFLVVSHNAANRRYTARIFSPERSPLARFSLHTPEAITLSPTNAYLAVANTPLSITLHKTNEPQSPESYLTELATLGAKETGRRYRNHLDEIPDQLPAPSSHSQSTASTLKLLEESMKVAEKTQQWSEVRRIADQILPLSPQNSAALSAKKKLNELQDEQRIKLGKRHIEVGEYEQSVRVLRQIKKSSLHHETARRLIVQAEQQIEIALKLNNAEEQMRRKNWKAAEAFLALILKLDPENKKALELLDQIQSQNQWRMAQNLLLLLLGIAALGGTGYFILKRKKQTELDSEPLEQVYQEPQAKKTQTSRTSSQKSGRQKAKNKTKYRDSRSITEAYFLDSLNKTKEMLRLAKRKDVENRHATRLMDFEAEINVIAQKAELSTANLKDLSNQLLVLLQTMRSLDFKVRPRGRHRASSSEKTQSQTSAAPETTPEAAPETYYSLLGISNSATSKVIKKAYHQKVKEYHPDRHQNSEFEWIQEQAEAMTRSLHEAYETLIDEKSRAAYDKKLKK